MKSSQHIAFVSSSNDLYGSSRVLLQLLLCMQHSGTIRPLACLPPGEGPLKDALREAGVKIVEMPVMQLTRSMLRSFKVFGLMADYFKARRVFKRETAGLDIRYIQSNTLATLFGAVFCRFSRHKHLFHVHEIVDHPALAASFFKGLIRGWCDGVIFNSVATANYYTQGEPHISQKAVTIVNGVPEPEHRSDPDQRKASRARLFEEEDRLLLIGLIGRINRLKGHQTLLEAFAALEKDYPMARLVFVGSPPPGQDVYLNDLTERIEHYGLGDKVKLVDFQQQVFPIFEAMDIVTVPSTEAESFGLVAVEAMLAARAVVASDIGGLPYIIDEGQNGLLCTPGDANSLAVQLRKLLDDPALRAQLGQSAKQKAQTRFSLQRMCGDFEEFYTKLLRDE
jgi:glycosyltransferase involved in cell wall biosynthesis